MAEINTKFNEKIQEVKEITSKPLLLSEEQKNQFTSLIKDNSPFLQDQISQLKKDFPADLGSVNAFSDFELSSLTGIDTEKLQTRLENYKKNCDT